MLIQIHLTNVFRAHSSKQSLKLVIYPLTRWSFQTSTFMLSPTHNAWEKRFLLKCEWSSSHTQCDQRIFCSCFQHRLKAEHRKNTRKGQVHTPLKLNVAHCIPAPRELQFSFPLITVLEVLFEAILPQWLQRIKEMKTPQFHFTSFLPFPFPSVFILWLM